MERNFLKEVEEIRKKNSELVLKEEEVKKRKEEEREKELVREKRKNEEIANAFLEYILEKIRFYQEQGKIIRQMYFGHFKELSSGGKRKLEEKLKCSSYAKMSESDYEKGVFVVITSKKSGTITDDKEVIKYERFDANNINQIYQALSQVATRNSLGDKTVLLDGLLRLINPDTVNAPKCTYFFINVCSE